MHTICMDEKEKLVTAWIIRGFYYGIYRNAVFIINNC